MKPVLTLLFSILIAGSACGQIDIPSSDWRSDLRFLQETIHSNYPFLFKKITAADFDAQVEQLYQAIPDMQEHQIVTGFARIVASFGYGHTVLGIRGSAFHYHKLPLNLYQFSDGLFVEGVQADYQEALGAKLLAIEGVPVEDALAAIRPVVSAENDQFFKAYGPGWLCISEILHAQGVTGELKTTLTLTLQRDGQSFEYPVTAVKAAEFPIEYGFTTNNGDWLSARDQGRTPLYLSNLEKHFAFEYLPEQRTVYVRQSQIQDDNDETIAAFYTRLVRFIDEHDVDRLVLDVRLNDGGNNYRNKPVVTGIIRSQKINQPGKLFVIIGRRTFSACQNLVNELDNYTNAIFVGEPTSENINFYGDNRRVELPHSKLPVFLSFAWWQDKPQWENAPWLAPHLAVEMSFDDYRSNCDPVLDAALQFADDDFIRDPLAYLSELFQTQQLEKLESEAQRMVNDPNYRFFDFEQKFDQLGHDLMGRDQIEPAIHVFTQNNKLFPGSANRWNSLGKAYLKVNQAAKAAEQFRKAVELDPDGAAGDEARELLRQIGTGPNSADSKKPPLP